MQYGESYIGRSFKLKRAHHINEKSTLTAGMIGTSLGVDSKAARLLLLFATPERDIETWVEEGNLLLAESAQPSGDPAEQTRPKPLPAPEGPKALAIKDYADKLTAVKSSNLKAIGLFSAEGLDLKESDVSSADLVVAFTNGTAYRYRGVSSETFNEMLSADSAGKYFNAKIKGNSAFESLKLEA